VAVARRDPKRAYALIDQALSLPVDQGPALDMRSPAGGATGTAARIAVCARRAGYPDMDSVIARVLATRPAPDRYFSRMGPTLMIESAPALLALTDRAAAGEMLRQIAAGQGSLAMPEARGVGDRWLVAWGLADPQYARSRVEGEPAAIEERRASQLLRLAELLAAPPALRAELLWEPKFMTWYPGRKLPDY
jgi:hypothetical protein